MAEIPSPMPRRVVTLPDYEQVAAHVKKAGSMLLEPTINHAAVHATMSRKFGMGLTPVRQGKTLIGWRVQSLRQTS